MTGIAPDTAILFAGDLERAKQPGSEMNQETGINTTPFVSRLTIEVDEQYETDRLLSTAVYQAENLFTFRDDALETYIKPTYSSADVTINFKNKFVDKTSAMRWRDSIRTKVSMMWDVRTHAVSYHYLIPPEMLVILGEIYRLRENVAGYGDTWDQYLLSHSTNNLSVFTDLAGNNKAVGISENQLRIIGYFDFEGVPEQGSKEDEGDTWTISFAYKFKFDKPISCVMFYPLMFHNQLLDQRFRPDPNVDKPDPLLDVNYNFNLSAGFLSAFEKNRLVANPYPGVSIPSFDEFLPNSIEPNTMRVFTALTNIDPNDPLMLLNLYNMGNTTLDPAVLNFLVGEVPYILKQGMSVFTLSLYSSIDLLDNINITIDTALNVRSLVQLSLRNYYHVRLGLAVDWTLLAPSALDRLRNYGDALAILLNTIDPTLNAKGLLPTPIGSNYVTRADLIKAVNEINKPTITQGNNQIGSNLMYTVQTLSIIASKGA